jgi:endonuclease/exonuclease/phosphatase family metal-dependent hydrolase
MDAPPQDFNLSHDPDDDPELYWWRGNVGEPVRLDLAPPAAAGVCGLDLLCWNLAIGEARLVELLHQLQEGRFGGAGTDPRRPLVVLGQEAFRADSSVPATAVGRFHGGRIRKAQRTDIADVARECGFSLRYAPSMRNGRDRSDRGNAILANVAIANAHAFSLPYVRQHRVAVAAELAGLPRLTLVSAHLDTGGRLRGATPPSFAFGAGRAAQAANLARRMVAADAQGGIIVGADLNTPLGMRDPAFLALVRAGFTPASRKGSWRHTFHGPIRFLLDHVLFYPAARRIRSAEVMRLDEHPADRGARIFGSDHHPLLVRATLNTDR